MLTTLSSMASVCLGFLFCEMGMMVELGTVGSFEGKVSNGCVALRTPSLFYCFCVSVFYQSLSPHGVSTVTLLSDWSMG